MSYDTQLVTLIEYLQKERPEKHFPSLSDLSILEKWEVFRGLCNERKPEPVTDVFLEIQNDFLTKWNREETLITMNDMTAYTPHLYLWQGDITHLKVDGIVNAANSTLLGCTRANHDCIDNIIHTKAGVQLRLTCHQLMTEQGRSEPIGKAKITPAFNLPPTFVIHTVGPFIDARGVTPLREKLLRDAYYACLQVADEHGLSSIAFPCISTGEFQFPNERAAEIALETVQKYIEKTSTQLKIVFNVFKDEDKYIYESLLTEGV